MDAKSWVEGRRDIEVPNERWLALLGDRGRGAGSMKPCGVAMTGYMLGSGVAEALARWAAVSSS